MASETLHIQFERFNDLDEMPIDLQPLVVAARKATADAYAPYSLFQVSAAAIIDGKIITATNQENASYPVTLCAERTLLSVLTTQFADKQTEAIAICYHNKREGANNSRPISPCGLCRQSLLEYEQRNKKNIKVLLTAQSGEIIVLQSIRDLLPFSFSTEYFV